jgi:hypothetical protein
MKREPLGHLALRPWCDKADDEGWIIVVINAVITPFERQIPTKCNHHNISGSLVRFMLSIVRSFTFSDFSKAQLTMYRNGTTLNLPPL